MIKARIRKSGSELISQIWRGDVVIARKGQLVNLKQDKIAEDEERRQRPGTLRERHQKVTVEQAGPVRAVVRIDGRHKPRKGKTWLPFSVRLYFYAGAENVRMVHTFVYDRDGASRTSSRGLGVRFRVPMRDAAYDRHVRFVGEGTRHARARRSRASPVCAATPARPYGPRRSRGRSCPTRPPGTSGSPPGCSTSPSGATTRSASCPPTASR